MQRQKVVFIRGYALAVSVSNKSLSVNLPTTNDTKADNPCRDEGYFLCVIRLVERKKKVPTVADTRLITPYTSYLLPGFQ